MKPLTADEMRKALAEAERKATAIGRPMVIAHNRRWDHIWRGPWRVAEPGEVEPCDVIVNRVLPRVWPQEMVQAECRMIREFTDAAPALDAMLTACIRRSDGTARAEDERFEMIRRLCDYAERRDITPLAADTPPYHARRADMPGYQEPRS